MRAAASPHPAQRLQPRWYEQGDRFWSSLTILQLEHGRNSFEPSSSIFNHGFSPIASVNTSSATDLDRVQAKKAEEENMKKRSMRTRPCSLLNEMLRYAMSTSPVGLQDAPMDTPKVRLFCHPQPTR
eukprot:748417-Hanusia_phi.AAC.4